LITDLYWKSKSFTTYRVTLYIDNKLIVIISMAFVL